MLSGFRLVRLSCLLLIVDGVCAAQGALSQAELTKRASREFALTPNLRAAGPQRRVSIPGLNNKECGTPVFVSSREMLFTGPTRGGVALFRGSVAGNKPPVELTELGGNVNTPDLSRDGRKLAFARQAFDTNVWRLDLDAPAGKEIGRARVLASTLRDQNVSLSPDGRALAFESTRGGSFEIWVASRDGSNPRQLTSFGMTSSPRWSPDGSLIAFDGTKTGKQDVYVIPAAGGAPRQLTFDPTDAQQPIWSPDSQWIFLLHPLRTARDLADSGEWRRSRTRHPARRI